MTTLLQAVERAREREGWPPHGDVRVSDLLAHYSPSPAGSVRALLARMSDLATAKKPWAVILCRFQGEPPTRPGRGRRRHSSGKSSRRGKPAWSSSGGMPPWRAST
jgi:hypothetical protein